ncbi:hypothetical protein [Nocardia asteroides]|uniref:hypothetical protein n=1 Tax=Nocardia asteroides TaxID=1824 RepID=UPI001E402DFD|nr:hypothetical protein [Nocardia asteroides]UGT63324.1 hypothetical protein LTT61_08455 [Nocardia asteroides]
MTTSSTTRRILATLALTGTVAGVIAGAAGTAGAAPRDSRYGRDDTGWDHIDPRGYHHDSDDPRSRAETRDNRRAYYADNYPGQSVNSGSGGDNTTWSRSDNEDGWTVCKPQARYC